MFVTVVNEPAGTKFPAILVSEDTETATATLCVFTQEGALYMYYVPSHDHSFTDENGDHPFSYYEAEDTSAPASTELVSRYGS